MAFVFNPFTGNFDYSVNDLADLATKNHSDLDQLAWSVAGHTFDTDVNFNNQILRVGTDQYIKRGIGSSQGIIIYDPSDLTDTIRIGVNASRQPLFWAYKDGLPGTIDWAGDIIFNTDNTENIGDATHRLKDLYVAGNISDATNVVTVANLKTTYNYSQVGHLPLAGGTMTGAIDLNTNNLNNIRFVYGKVGEQLTIQAGRSNGVLGSGEFIARSGDGIDGNDGGAFQFVGGNGDTGASGGTMYFSAGNSGLGAGDGGNIEFFVGSPDVGGSAGVYKFYEQTQSNAGILDFESVTEDRTFTFPNQTGTIALTSDIPTITEDLAIAYAIAL